jgi:hypothetical protein
MRRSSRDRCGARKSPASPFLDVAIVRSVAVSKGARGLASKSSPFISRQQFQDTPHLREEFSNRRYQRIDISISGEANSK